MLLAAGFGTRLRPITDTVPKCLVPVRGRPLLEHWFDLLFSAGIERVLINTHYLPDVVRRFVAQSPWSSRVDIAYEETLLGTGGTVLRNREYFAGQSFMLAHADNLSSFDVHAFLARHQERPPGAEITMMTFDTDSPRSCGIVETDPQGLVTGFHEKVPDPPGRRANGAVYIFEPTILDFLRSLSKPVIDLSTEVLPRHIGRIFTFHNDDYHRDIGTPESLRLAESEFSSRV
ncbi:MAG: nucleotidyltransferase family protein [Betaproteobacteria bacterium]